MFAVVSLVILKDSPGYTKSDQGEDRFYAELRKNLQYLWHFLLHLLQMLLALAI